MCIRDRFEDAVYTYQELFRQDGIRLEYDDDGELYTDCLLYTSLCVIQ